MGGIEYLYLASGFVLLAVILHVITRFDGRAWATRGLKRGDLHSLSDVASGRRPNGLTPDQADRLQARGMVRACGNGNFRATIKGRLVLRIRQMARRRSRVVA